MSADNFVGVYEDQVRVCWVVCEGMMSTLLDNRSYYGTELSRHLSREEALVDAHDRASWMPLRPEYGVIELEPRKSEEELTILIRTAWRLEAAKAVDTPNTEELVKKLLAEMLDRIGTKYGGWY